MNHAERKLVLTRKKSFSGCALKFAVYLDKTPVGMLANGETLEIPMSSQAHTLRVVPSTLLVKAPAPVEIRAGFAGCEATLGIHNPMGLKADWRLELEYRQRSREESLQLICGTMLLLSSRSDGRSLVPKMEEFRRAGLDLHVSFTVRAEDVLVAPNEKREGRFVGESFGMNYRDLTSAAGDAPVNSLSAAEQMELAEEFERLLGASGEHSGLNVSRFGPTVTISLK